MKKKFSILSSRIFLCFFFANKMLFSDSKDAMKLFKSLTLLHKL